MTANSHPAAALAIALLLGAGLAATMPAQAGPAPVRFGMDLGSAAAQTAAGAPADLGTFWVGPWTLKHGWGGPDAELAKAYGDGITPVVHFYYWGDDISPSCVRDGCWSNLHQAQKDQAGWQRLAEQLADHLAAQMKGREAMILLESEFNKGGIETDEEFDGMLADKARFFHERYPAARVVLAFGNWGSEHWGRFDRAAAACDLVGIQGMRGSTRDSLTHYLGLPAATLDGARTLQTLFSKPILVTDLAASTYPEPEYLDHQQAVMRDVFARMEDLKAAGVVGLLYRSFTDNPNMDTANYYGPAERHWGLRHADGTAKPALDAWVAGVRAERTGPAPAPTTSTAAAPVSVGVAATGTTRIEVDTFQDRPVGGRQADAAASAGHRWNLWSDGTVTQRVDLASPGDWDLVVRARGQSLADVPPHMDVLVDGATVAAADPADDAWRDARVRLAGMSAGVHTVGLRFTNDATSSQGDRNLLLDYVDLSHVPAPAPTSTPTAPAPVPLTATSSTRVEAEAFATRTAGGREADASASDGARWNLWSNGHIAQLVDAPTAGSWDLAVTAQGQALAGVHPHMEILVDGAVVRTADPGPGSWQTVSVRLTGLAAGTHEIRLRFTNDAMTADGDRNLLVDRIDIQAAVAPAPTTTTSPTTTTTAPPTTTASPTPTTSTPTTTATSSTTAPTTTTSPPPPSPSPPRDWSSFLRWLGWR